MTNIILEDITHIYNLGTPRETLAIRDLDIEFPDGSFVALLGPSGCGKTTLLRIISGLTRQTRGYVYFDGKEVTPLTPRERNVAMIFQFPVLYKMNVFENIAFPLRCIKVPDEEVKKKVTEIAELVEISHLLYTDPRRLDFATKQKIILCRALVREPTVFILDEPLTNLEPMSRFELRLKIKELQSRMKTNMIYVTHDQTEALALAHKIAVMKEGEIVQYDKPEVLLDRPKNTFVGFFLGSPGMHFLNCKLKGTTIDFRDFTCNIKGLLSEDVLEKFDNKELIFGIRPEYVLVSKKERPGYIKARRGNITNIGIAFLVDIYIGDKRLKAKVKEGDLPEEVYVGFQKEKICLFEKEKGELIMKNTEKE
jgi:ABC-type sugar transport system ATPase subunit